LLGGALGVNYVAPDDLGGSVTFKTEQPIPKGQLLQLVRDILGRNGLEMRFTNGVYHIGTPDAMAALQKTTAAGRSSDLSTRVVKLRKGGATEIISFVRQLLPDEVTLAPSNGGESIIVRAVPDDLDKISELISIAENGVGDDRVAIVPVRQTSPEKLAAQLSEFYRSQVGNGAEGITVIPLENQQALLIGARDRRLLQGLRKLVAQLDRDTGGDMTLRIIPLTHLGAEEIVPQLTNIFGGNASAGAVRSRSPLTAQSASQGPGTGSSGTSSQSLQSGTSSSGSTSGSNTSAASDTMAASTEQSSSPAQAPAAGGGPSVRFVADTRNNTVMIYSY
jgi:general secretion pathway protein D